MSRSLKEIVLRERRVWDIVKSNPGITITGIQKETLEDRTTVRKRVQVLKSCGKIDIDLTCGPMRIYPL